jgi:hypothetical protein
MRSIYFLVLLQFVSQIKFFGQTNNSSPYCLPLYSTVPCNQGGPSNSPSAYINDNINHFVTSGAVVNISNMNSGCNGMANNYIYYCNHNLQVNPGTIITCSIQSGITFAQGFAIFIDWNQDNTFQIPSERVTAVPGTPAAATWGVASFTVPATQSNGVYRLRLRSVYFAMGPNIVPCNNYGYGECEDYNVYVGLTPPVTSTTTASATNNSPVCPGQNVNLSATSSSSTTFNWTGPLNYTSTLQNSLLANVTLSMAGTYYVAVTSGTCPVLAGTYVSISPCTQLADNNLNLNTISVYPNPFNNELKINGTTDIFIYDLLGKLILSTNVTEEKTIDTHSFLPGIYFVSYKENGRSNTVKLIKNSL